MAISSYKTFLMRKETDAYKKLIDIKSFPDLGGKKEMLEKTTLSDGMQTFIDGIRSNGGLEFNANYDSTDYDTIKALEDKELDLAVWFGGDGEGETLTPTGSHGKFSFKGYISVYVAGTDVNKVVEMKISVAPSTEIIKEKASV